MQWVMAILAGDKDAVSRGPFEDISKGDVSITPQILGGPINEDPESEVVHLTPQILAIIKRLQDMALSYYERIISGSIPDESVPEVELLHDQLRDTAMELRAMLMHMARHKAAAANDPIEHAPRDVPTDDPTEGETIEAQHSDIFKSLARRTPDEEHANSIVENTHKAYDIGYYDGMKADVSTSGKAYELAFSDGWRSREHDSGRMPCATEVVTARGITRDDTKAFAVTLGLSLLWFVVSLVWIGVLWRGKRSVGRRARASEQIVRLTEMEKGKEEEGVVGETWEGRDV